MNNVLPTDVLEDALKVDISEDALDGNISEDALDGNISEGDDSDDNYSDDVSEMMKLQRGCCVEDVYRN